MEENDLLEDHFMYPTLRSLKEMTSHEIALCVWHHYYFSRVKYNENARERFPFRLMYTFGINDTLNEEFLKNHGYEIVESLKLPGSMKDEIKRALCDVYHEIRSWLRKFGQCQTPLRFSKSVIESMDLSKIVWFSNGCVHHEMSTRKILPTIELIPEVKFSFMSEFCLEDEILNFDVNSLPEDFVQQVTVDDSSKYPLLNYWVRYLKKEPHLHNLRSPALVKIYYERNRMAGRYFWNLLDSNDRASLVELLFSSEDGYDDCEEKTLYLYRYYNKERLFFMLSPQQQHSILVRLCDRIILYFSRCEHLTHKPSALWAWRQSREFMSLEQFSHVMERSLYDYSRFAGLYVEICKTVPERFRHYLLNSHEDEMNEMLVISSCLDNYHLHSSDCRHSPSVHEFFIEFLSLKSADSRKRIITGRRFHYGCAIKNLQSLQELFDLCLPDRNEQLEFKRKVIDSDRFKDTCTKLLKNLNFTELNAKLKFYLPDRNVVQEFVGGQLLNGHGNVFDSMINFHFIYKLENWNKLSNFVDEIFHGDASVSLDVKRRFISSVVSRFHCSSVSHGYHGVDEMIQIVETIFLNEELEDIKRSFLDSIQRKFADRSFWNRSAFYFKVDCVLGIVSWCLRDSNEQTIRKFKNNFLPVDIFFDGIFHVLKEKCAFRDDNFILMKKLLFKLNRCLRWYMPSKEERKKYKRSRIYERDNFKIFDVLKSKKKRSDLEILLKWLFDNDEKAITEFKSSKLK